MAASFATDHPPAGSASTPAGINLDRRRRRAARPSPAVCFYLSRSSTARAFLSPASATTQAGPLPPGRPGVHRRRLPRRLPDEPPRLARDLTPSQQAGRLREGDRPALGGHHPQRDGVAPLERLAAAGAQWHRRPPGRRPAPPPWGGRAPDRRRRAPRRDRRSERHGSPACRAASDRASRPAVTFGASLSTSSALEACWRAAMESA